MLAKGQFHMIDVLSDTQLCYLLDCVLCGASGIPNGIATCVALDLFGLGPKIEVTGLSTVRPLQGSDYH